MLYKAAEILQYCEIEICVEKENLVRVNIMKE